MSPIRLRHFWICKKSPVVRGKHAGAQQRDYGLQLWWPVLNSGFLWHHTYPRLFSRDSAVLIKGCRL
nr:MAG TPA: hypothetical protein [Caudoviricetes sp.]